MTHRKVDAADKVVLRRRRHGDVRRGMSQPGCVLSGPKDADLVAGVAKGWGLVSWHTIQDAEWKDTFHPFIGLLACNLLQRSAGVDNGGWNRQGVTTVVKTGSEPVHAQIGLFHQLGCTPGPLGTIIA